MPTSTPSASPCRAPAGISTCMRFCHTLTQNCHHSLSWPFSVSPPKRRALSLFRQFPGVNPDAFVNSADAPMPRLAAPLSPLSHAARPGPPALLSTCLRGQASVISWCPWLPPGVSPLLPSPCTSLLSRVPLAAGWGERLPMAPPASAPAGLPARNLFLPRPFSASPFSSPCFRSNISCCGPFVTAGQLSLQAHNRTLSDSLRPVRISGPWTTVSPAPSTGRCSSAVAK